MEVMGSAGRLGFPCSRPFVWDGMVSSVAEPVRECPANERQVHPVDGKKQPSCADLGS